MGRQKIDFGIDLGTTNSAIAKMENGEIKIIKSIVGQMDTTPSVVYFDGAKHIYVGIQAYNQISKEYLKALKENQALNKNRFITNVFFEFKRTMGSDKLYKCKNTYLDYSSEQLSAEVLKKLKSYIIDENLLASVITVPARFRQMQVDATQRAAKLAGFEYVELLQEPIAASLAYGISPNKMNGFWIVFDFGGGTFDVALMNVVEGIIKVIDTDGDENLGGKDIDYAVVDNIFIPRIQTEKNIDNILADEYSKLPFREVLKFKAEEIKKELSSKSNFTFLLEDIGQDDDGNDLEIEIAIEQKEFERVIQPIFQRAIDKTFLLLERNKVSRDDLVSIILIGGPTFSPTLRNMLRDQLINRIDTSIDPMTAVAIGAAIFASTKDIPQIYKIIDKKKIQLEVIHTETTVETEETIGIIINKKQNSANITEKVFIELLRFDKAWSSGRIALQNHTAQVKVLLNVDEINNFTISLFDDYGNILGCEPSNFTIIQGINAPDATLPYSICVDAYIPEKNKNLLVELPGLEKNQRLPAMGKRIFKNTFNIRPGNKEDKIEIAIYEGDPFTKSMHNEFAQKFDITGEEIHSFLPKESDIEITIEVDCGRRMKISVYIPYLNDAIEKELPVITQKEPDSKELNSQIIEAKNKLSEISLNRDNNIISEHNLEKLDESLKETQQLLKDGGSDYDTKTKVLKRLREALKVIDKIEDSQLQDIKNNELNTAFEELKNQNMKYGNNQTSDEIKDIERYIETKEGKFSEKEIDDLLEKTHTMILSLLSTQIGFWVGYLKYINDNFDQFQWSDRNRASNLLKDVKQRILNNPTIEYLREIVRQLYLLLPYDAPRPDIKLSLKFIG